MIEKLEREMDKKREKRGKKEREDAGASEEEFTRRCKMIQDVMNEPAYVPMKLKELALLLNIPKEQRRELQRVIDYLLEEGKSACPARASWDARRHFQRQVFIRDTRRVSVL